MDSDESLTLFLVPIEMGGNKFSTIAAQIDAQVNENRKYFAAGFDSDNIIDALRRMKCECFEVIAKLRSFGIIAPTRISAADWEFNINRAKRSRGQSDGACKMTAERRKNRLRQPVRA